MAGFKFDHEKEGLGKTLKEYGEVALRYVWSMGEEGVGSAKTWANTNETLKHGEAISRASVIFFLNRMVDQRALSYRTATGKGGHHRVYYSMMDEKTDKKHIMKTIVESPMRDSPTRRSPRGTTAPTGMTLNRSPVYFPATEWKNKTQITPLIYL
jgi:predicted transcriptional regulator